METREQREARLKAAVQRIGGVFQDSSGSKTYTSMYDIEADAKEWAPGWDPDEQLKTGKSHSASDVEKKWHVEPRYITLTKYLKKSPGTKLGKEVYSKGTSYSKIPYNYV